MLTREKALELGKRWTKNGMDRVYFNIREDEEYDGIRVRNYFNRYEWQNLKVYYDLIKDELVITTGKPDAKEAVTAILEIK